MYIQNLNNNPQQITEPRAAIEAIHVRNATGSSVFVKLYQSINVPTAMTNPNFCWEVEDGESVTLLVAKDFVEPCWSAVSATAGASLDPVAAGLDINISEDSRQL